MIDWLFKSIRNTGRLDIPGMDSSVVSMDLAGRDRPVSDLLSLVLSKEQSSGLWRFALPLNRLSFSHWSP